MQSGGGVTEVWWMGDIMGCLPPDPFVCVRVRAGCVREKEETASGAHAATKTRKYI